MKRKHAKYAHRQRKTNGYGHVQTLNARQNSDQSDQLIGATE
jgi:hypothetical protein